MQPKHHLLSPPRTYILVHFRVVEHGDKLLEEGLVGNLPVEGSAASVHQNVEKTEREKDDAKLGHLKAAKQLLRHYLSAKNRKIRGKSMISSM